MKIKQLTCPERSLMGFITGGVLMFNVPPSIPQQPHQIDVVPAIVCPPSVIVFPGNANVV